MSEILKRILDLVSRGDLLISDRGYEELASDGILVRDVVAGVTLGAVIEEYPAYPKGPCILVVQRDNAGAPIHVLWGIPHGADAPAVVVTAYRPDPRRWNEGFSRRRS